VQLLTEKDRKQRAQQQEGASTMQLHIRSVRVADAETIASILNAIIQAGAYTVLDRTFTAEEERRYIARFPERGVFHVAIERESGRLVGLQSVEPFATYTRAFAHVGTIGTFVDLAMRRQGIGTQLSQVTFKRARGRGYEKLFTYVRADNAASLAFHLKLGFRIVGTAERQAKVKGTYVDEIIVEKFL
jgi:L-amino acid N-acyltransferase YncA